MAKKYSFWQHQNSDIRIAVIDETHHLAEILKVNEIPFETELTLEEAEQKLDELSRYSIIMVGVTLYPIRRRVIGELRKVCPDGCLVFLRISHGVAKVKGVLEVRDHVVADFMLSSSSISEVWKAAKSLAPIFPLANPEIDRSPEALVVERAVKVIAKSFADPALNLHSVADKLNLSAGQLSRILNKHAKMRFRQLLQQTRLEAAKQMLARGNLSVKEVAYKVGFSDSDYFSRAFKRYFGDCATTYKANPAV